MESILARALEYTLKYWLKSFSRDQFKLQGRTVQLSNLDINGDALHASLGLPPALNVMTAKVGKLEIKLPSVSNVQTEPIAVQIDRLDVVLEEKSDSNNAKSSNSTQASSGSGKGSGYGFADKIADGMTLEVGTVNLLVETHAGAHSQGSATCASPMASITIRNLLLYTTNENWKVVNLKEARDFSNNKKCIYVFKKLEWRSLSVDLLPHPDMFTDAHSNKYDDDSKRVFFGGERFLEGISGQAYITIQRTELNSPLGLEVQLHITEAVCPALSEPEFQLELLTQSLFFSRASVSHGENTKTLSQIMVGGLFLRDTLSHPPCTLVQPSVQAVIKDVLIPEFAMNFCPSIYPLGDRRWKLNKGTPLICLYSLQIKPSPAPPSSASQTVINCQPLMINLQEESCLKISSFLSDGIVVNPGAVLIDSSVMSFVFTLEELDLTVPLDFGKSDNHAFKSSNIFQSAFSGARLHIEDMFFSESPALKLRLLNLDKDPACFCLWEGQPIDASQNKWTIQASHLNVSLETCNGLIKNQSSVGWSEGLWRCVELHDACIEAAMVTADGSPLVTVPPPGGIVRIGVACKQIISNTSVEHLFFVLDLYSYFGRVGEKIAKAGKNNRQKRNRRKYIGGELMEKAPGDTAVSLEMNGLQLRFLESSLDIQGIPLVQFIGEDLFIKVTHRTLGGAIAVSSTVRWESVQVNCVNAERNLPNENGASIEHGILVNGNGYPNMIAIFWIENRRKHQPHDICPALPFLEISMVHVIPLNAEDSECHCLTVSANVSGVCLGGGMTYAEALLHRFGILGPDGGPGEGLLKGLKNLSSGPLSKLFRTSSFVEDDQVEQYGSSEDGGNDGFLDLGIPDNVEVTIEFKDWLFILEGAQEMAERLWFYSEDVGREERCWHTTFQSLYVKAKSNPKHVGNGLSESNGRQKCPVELVKVGVEGLQALKPQDGASSRGIKGADGYSGGVNLEVQMVISEDNEENEMAKWAVENMKFSVKQPIEAVATKRELQHLALLCKSELDSMGRIAAGVLHLLKLESSVGQAAIDQLRNLGRESLDKIFTPEKFNQRNSANSIEFEPTPKMISESSHQSLESTVASLEAAIQDSQTKCSVLVAESQSQESSLKQHIVDIEQLSQKLESMRTLLTQLRTQL
ncbi:PREDICTED: uncharacterized protein LOC104604912 isoform X2 [Nelumbo nucifera]|uniref:Uncharacterized protein LOC104604912 isoform X2 n=1 Tax=Nelumbo nucifera TaxID=4432 RepID=A0A1U8AJC4_NELNU|nr:PREDICTED: uncharacterized protein LOC104604912 isoform X2 [Nelumbo nucifera]